MRLVVCQNTPIKTSFMRTSSTIQDTRPGNTVKIGTSITFVGMHTCVQRSATDSPGQEIALGAKIARFQATRERPPFDGFEIGNHGQFDVPLWKRICKMPGTHGRILRTINLLLFPLLLSSIGCHVVHNFKRGHHLSGGTESSEFCREFDDMPRELSKTSLPSYVIEPPDILYIETIHAVPKSPYYLKTLDVLSIRVMGTLPEAPIAGSYPIEPGGVINLGAPYGVIQIAGMTVPEAKTAITDHLKEHLKEPIVAAALTELGASQRIVGQFLVGPDGTITLGSYGSIHITGNTLDEAKDVIEKHLSKFLEDPVVSLNVHSFNSKVYYVVLQGAELGDGVYRFPITGNDTVLDAIAQISGLQQISSKRIWVARASDDCGDSQVMPVDWRAITETGQANTNYQLLPGDRLFVAEDKLVAFDNKLAKIFGPIERVMGLTLLGTGTATRLTSRVLHGGGNPRSAF